MGSSQRTLQTPISRRALLFAVAGTCVTALARARIGHAVQMVTPPEWLREAYQVIRSIQLPRTPGRVEPLTPPTGDARVLIQSAIDTLAQRGGGRVSLAAGGWRSNGPLRLRSKVELHLCEGAHLVFSGDRQNYLPVVHTRWEGTDLYGYSPCIYAYKVVDVAVTGAGSLMVERSGDMENWRAEQTEAQKRLRSMGATGVPLQERVFAEGRFLRPSFIQFFGCERVLVEGISIGSIPFWGVHLVYSTHCTVRKISVKSERVNNDGVDIDSSRHVAVEQCVFETGDDCVAIKSGRDLDGRTINQPSEDIVIRDCQMRYGRSAGIAIGSEMSGGVRRVYILRCDMGKVDTALNVKANLDRGGVVEHVRAWNLRIRECGSVLQVTTAYHGYMGGNFPPRFEDVEVDDVRCKRAKRAIVVRGDNRSVIRRLALRQVDVEEAPEVNIFSNVEQVLCDGVTVGGSRLVSGCVAKVSN
jgi:polygalacturonase